MKNYNMILTEKQQRYPALLSGKVDNYEYFTDQEMLPSMKSIMIEQATFTYSPLGKALDYQKKKQVDSAKSLKLQQNI